MDYLFTQKTRYVHILENARPKCLVLTVSNPLELTSETTLGGYF
jgi:hypothetical protein